MNARFRQSLTSDVARLDDKIVLTMSPEEARLLAASLVFVDLGGGDHLSWLGRTAEMLSDAARVRSASASRAAVFAERDSTVELTAAEPVAAGPLEAALHAERAVHAAADRAREAASAAQEACAADTARIAAAIADTVRRQASAVQDHADAEARQVAEAAVRAASRVASAVLPGHEAEARTAAVLVAQVTDEAAAATAAETALMAAAAARAAAAAALDAAAEAADAAMWIELKVRGAARDTQNAADAAATELSAQQEPPLG